MGAQTVSWLQHHAGRTPDKLALVDLHTGRSTSYAELDRRVRSFGHALAERFGVRPGDRVTVLSRNDTRVFEVLYACALVGAVAVPLNWRLTAAELTAITIDAEPVVFVYESWAEEVAKQVSEQAGRPATVSWDSDVADADSYEPLATAEVPDTWSPPVVTDDTVWTIIYTSGTTGLPKGVQSTHRGVLASMLGILVAHGVTASSRCLTVLPTFHVAGLNLHANPVLYAGGTVVVCRNFDPAQTLRLITDTKEPVTHLCGVPAIYQFMQQLAEFADAPLRPFLAAVGGSPVPPALVSAWDARGVALTTVFGITEAGACVTTMPPGRELDRAGTIGLPTMYAQCRVRTETNEPVLPGETGELQIAGAVVSPGYWRKPDATAEAFTPDGWLRTGDAASLTKDGFLVLVDRWKDMYISGGENVYPAEVENVLHAHPDVSQAAVIGVPHPRWGESGAAFVVAARGASIKPDELIIWCKQQLAGYKVPSQVMIVDELPRNATGKILKKDLRQAVRDTATSSR